MTRLDTSHLPDVLVKFAPKQKLPPGYRVIWSHETEHYHAESEDGEWSSDIFCDRFDARRCAWRKYEKETLKS